MASVVRRPNGHRWIQLAVAGKRHTIRLGKVSESQATDFRRRIESLAAALTLGQLPDTRTLEWLTEIDRELYQRIAAVGLTEQRSSATSLDELLKSHAASMGIKESSKSTFAHTARNLREYFGGNRDYRRITTGDAKEFRTWLTGSARKKGAKGSPLAAATVSRRCRRSRQIFAYAVEKRWIPLNPFTGMRGWTESNRDRDHYVSRGDTEKLLAAADPQMRLLIAIARYGGVRCPSEAAPFQWDWIHWENGTMRIRAPKTERYPDGSQRTTPISADLRQHLDDAWAIAESNQPLLLPDLQLSANALSKRLWAICERAGVRPWKKPWNNMRASCETDWIAEHKDIFQVAAWMGHSPQVALQHYSRIAKELSTAAIGKAAAPKGRSKSRSNNRRQ